MPFEIACLTGNSDSKAFLDRVHKYVPTMLKKREIMVTMVFICFVDYKRAYSERYRERYAKGFETKLFDVAWSESDLS